MAWEVSEYKTISIELQSRDQDYTVDSEESAWLILKREPTKAKGVL